jgi:hypothetical protein
MDAAPRRPPGGGWLGIGVMVLAILIVGAILISKFVHPSAPVSPDVKRFRALYMRQHGAASVADDYGTLLTKADATDAADLLKYLQSLGQLNPGDRLEVGQALDHGPILVRDVRGGIAIAEIHVPGDLKLDSLNWNSSTTTQTALVASGTQRVEITPEVLKALAQRKQKLLDLGVAAQPSS